MLSMLTLLFTLIQGGEVPTAGRVLDGDGRPVADAQVVCLSRAIPRALEAGPDDRRVASTDTRGMFRIELLEHARYTVWASWQDGATGLIEGASAGEFLELRAAPATEPTTLELKNTEAWPEAASFRLRALVAGEHLDFVELSRTDDAWRLPPLPPMGHRQIEVLDGRGEVLWADRITYDGEHATLTLPDPIEHRVVVVDADGAAIPGCTVRWHIRNYWYCESPTLPFGERFRPLWPIVGTTDENGVAVIRIPRRSGQNDLWLLSQKPGYRMSLDGIDNGRRFGNGRMLADDETPPTEPIKVTLQASEPLVVTPRNDHGTAVAERWLYLLARVYVRRNGGASGTPLALAVPVTDGAAHLAMPLPAGTKVEFAEFVLAEHLATSLQQEHGVRPPTNVRIPDASRLLTAPDLVVVEPTAVRPLQVTAADGRPAARAIVLVEDGKRRTMLRTDRLGRALLPRGNGLRVGVLSTEGIAAMRLFDDEPAAVDLQLQPLRTFEILVVDDKHTALPAVRVAVQRLSSDAGADDVLWCASILLPLLPGVMSDAGGRVALSLPDQDCALRLTCTPPAKSGLDVVWDPAKPAVHRLIVAVDR